MDLREFSGKGDVNLHLSNVERYLTAPQEGYVPPPMYVEVPTFAELAEEKPAFGHGWMKYFHLTGEFTFINHGALGATLKDTLAFSQAYERYTDSQALRVLDREQIPLLAHVLREMAAFVGCEARDLFFIENCTAGISTVLNSLSFTGEDSILTLSIGYGAVGFAIDLVCERTGARHEKVQISLPITGAEQILDAVKERLHDGIKLAVFDHLPSNVPFFMPIQELAKLCKQRGILVLIDAAHSLGQLELNIPSYDVDFYITNCHKWFANTRGSAIGYVRRELQPQIRPLVSSWGFRRGFVAEFTWSGTQYYSQYVGLLSTLNFWKVVGPKTITDYCSYTVKQAAKMCCEAWDVQPTCPYDMIGMLVTIKLPAKLNDENWQPKSGVKKDIISDCLHFQHNIEVPIRKIDGTLYIRLSCHVYNQMSDYEALCAAVLDMCEKRDALIDYNTMFDQIPASVG